MSELVAVALEVAELMEAGVWEDAAGVRHDVRGAQAAAVSGTREVSAEALGEMVAAMLSARPGVARARVEVTGETTQAAARRLVVEEGRGDVLVLDFASAVEPGGGFWRGARAQEEDLCRCSGLWWCLAPHEGSYYARNRVPRERLWEAASAERAHVYTDDVLVVPGVPFFRVRSEEAPGAPWRASVLVAPAPNAGWALRADPGLGGRIAEVMDRRVGRVFGVARALGYGALVLGAWGCGAFGNDPAMVAGAFARWLARPEVSGSFERVVFAVWDGGEPGANLAAFRGALGGATSSGR
ncbi:MAG: TIGR02452 family protein [Deltaproteobacteria bacterium]|nr:TIGR02452 family protein [Deltaproteobacteria bacterium]